MNQYVYAAGCPPLYVVTSPGGFPSGPAEGVGLALLILVIVGSGVFVYLKVTRHRRVVAEKREARRRFRGSLFTALQQGLGPETPRPPAVVGGEPYAIPPIRRSPPLGLLSVATEFAFHVRGALIFGRREGFPVLIRSPHLLSRKTEFAVSVAPVAAPTVAGLVADEAHVRQAGLSPKHIAFDVPTTSILYTHSPVIQTRRRDIPEILGALLSIARNGGPPPGETCVMCQTQDAAGVAVVDGIPVQLCTEDFRRLQASPRPGRFVLRPTEADLRLALYVGLLGVALAAFLWAALVSLLGFAPPAAWIGIALVPVYFVRRGARIVTIPVLLVLMTLTASSVFLGDILWIAFALTQFDVPFNPVFALQVYPLILSQEPLLALSYLSAVGTALVAGVILAAVGLLPKRVLELVA